MKVQTNDLTTRKVFSMNSNKSSSLPTLIAIVIILIVVGVSSFFLANFLSASETTQKSEASENTNNLTPTNSATPSITPQVSPDESSEVNLFDNQGPTTILELAKDQYLYMNGVYFWVVKDKKVERQGIFDFASLSGYTDISGVNIWDNNGPTLIFKDKEGYVFLNGTKFWILKGNSILQKGEYDFAKTSSYKPVGSTDLWTNNGPTSMYYSTDCDKVFLNGSKFWTMNENIFTSSGEVDFTQISKYKDINTRNVWDANGPRVVFENSQKGTVFVNQLNYWVMTDNQISDSGTYDFSTLTNYKAIQKTQPKLTIFTEILPPIVNACPNTTQTTDPEKTDDDDSVDKNNGTPPEDTSDQEKGVVMYDLNEDKKMDIADFQIFLKLYKDNDLKADLNKDGKISLTDFTAFTNVYNTLKKSQN